MARAGRKRAVAREERYADISPARVRRAQEAAMAQGSDPLWGHHIGRLKFLRVIDDYEFAAAERFSREMADWAAAIGAHPNPSAIDYNRVQGRGSENETAEERAKRRWCELYGTLATVHRDAYAIARRACVCGEAMTLPGEVRVLRAALDRLAVFYGMRSQMRMAT